MTSQQYLEKQRARREKTGNAATKKYERTKKGKLMRTYRNMQSRVCGVQKQFSHLYEGKEILTREEFYEWSLSDPSFNRVYEAWVLSGYEKKLAPSIDRIDSRKGYTISNMEWVTHSENSKRSSSIKRRTNTSGVIGVYYSSQSRGWQAKFEESGKTYYAGLHGTIEDAEKAITQKRREVEESLNG